MRRSHLVIVTFLVCFLGGTVIYLMVPKQQTMDAAAISRMVQLGPAPSLQLAREWDIPTEPQKNKRQTHTHVALRIYWSGAAWPVPRGLGYAQSGQALALHTHAADGVVHIHLPAGHKPFTLRQVLLLWGLPLKSNQIDGQTITIWSNGKKLKGGLDQPLTNRADIIIEVGTPSPKAPLPAFRWSQIPLRSSS